MNPKKLIAILVSVGALAVLLFTVGHAVYYAPDSEITPTAVSTSTPGGIFAQEGLAANVTPEKYPVRLVIPSVGINAAVQYVGVKANGNMANPSNFTDVAWYKLGTVPGEQGSAVIGGHVDNALALSGVFKHLGSVKVGDDVYVTRKDGTKLDFKVTKIEEYPYQSAPAQTIFADPSGKKLNIITCSGTWLKDVKSYDKRLVVYTELVTP